MANRFYSKPHPNFKDLTEKPFGLLVVQKQAGKYKNGQVLWECSCQCGGKCIVSGSSLRRGLSDNCGCLMRKRKIISATTHGLSKTPEYRIWSKMLSRCLKSNDPAYPQYGGRGIGIDKSWLRFENFIAALGPRPRNDMTIERVDNNGNYEPRNVIWADRKTQARNRRSNSLIPFAGQRKTIAEWSEIQGIPYGTLVYRLVKAKWSIEKSMTTSVLKH